MSDNIQLDYANDRRPWSVQSVIAGVLGLVSGPIVVALVRLTGIAYGISFLGGAIAGIVAIVIVGYCLWAYTGAQGPPRMRGRTLALIGLVAAILWAVGLIALFCYIDAHLT